MSISVGEGNKTDNEVNLFPWQKNQYLIFTRLEKGLPLVKSFFLSRVSRQYIWSVQIKHFFRHNYISRVICKYETDCLFILKGEWV